MQLITSTFQKDTTADHNKVTNSLVRPDRQQAAHYSSQKRKVSLCPNCDAMRVMNVQQGNNNGWLR